MALLQIMKYVSFEDKWGQNNSYGEESSSINGVAVIKEHIHDKSEKVCGCTYRATKPPSSDHGDNDIDTYYRIYYTIDETSNTKSNFEKIEIYMPFKIVDGKIKTTFVTVKLSIKKSKLTCIHEKKRYPDICNLSDRYIDCFIQDNWFRYMHYVPNYNNCCILTGQFYRGNDVDRSKLKQGYMHPEISTIVDDPHQLWTYKYENSKQEFTDVFSLIHDKDEYSDAQFVHNIFTIASNLKNALELIHDSHTLASEMSADDIRDIINTSQFSSECEILIKKITDFNFVKSKLYQQLVEFDKI